MIPPPHFRPFRSKNFGDNGFSLVEVVLAVGVVAFAFVAILGLIPAGLTQFRQAIDTSVCAQIAQRVIMDAQQTDYDLLIDKTGLPSSVPDYYTFRAPMVANSEFRYFDEQGNEVIPSTTSAKKNPSALTADEKRLIVYHVVTRIAPNMNVPRSGNSAKGGALNTLANVTVQVAFNPGNLVIPIDTDGASGGAGAGEKPQRNLFVSTTPGVSLITYNAQVGQNQ